MPCRRGWEKDLGTIDGDVWETLLNSVPLVSVSVTQKLSDLFQLHRAYRTPQQLHKWGSRDSPLFSKCQQAHGDLLHMCPKLFCYWTEVISTIPRVYNYQLQKDPVACLLGALEEQL